MLEFDDSCYVDAKQYRLASFSTRNSTLIKYLASLTNQNARFYSIMRFFMKGCCVDFPIQMTQNCKHSKCLQILAEEDFPLKLLWRTPIKIHRRADRRRQPRSREHRFSTAKATSSTQRPQTCTEAATKYYNYIINKTDEEREHRLPTLPKATRLDQATLKVYSQDYLLRCSDRHQELCTSRIPFQQTGDSQSAFTP